MLYTYLGISSFFSRHLFCKLGDLKYFNRFYLYQGGMTIIGLCVLCLPLARSFGSVAAVFAVFGLMDGAMNGQFSLLILKCVGRHKLNQAWGHVMFFLGLSIGIGPPLAGELRFTGYLWTFYAQTVHFKAANHPLSFRFPFDGHSKVFLLQSFPQLDPINSGITPWE